MAQRALRSAGQATNASSVPIPRSSKPPQRPLSHKSTSHAEHYWRDAQYCCFKGGWAPPPVLEPEAGEGARSPFFCKGNSIGRDACAPFFVALVCRLFISEMWYEWFNPSTIHPPQAARPLPVPSGSSANTHFLRKIHVFEPRMSRIYTDNKQRNAGKIRSRQSAGFCPAPSVPIFVTSWEFLLSSGFNRRIRAENAPGYLPFPKIMMWTVFRMTDASRVREKFRM